MAKVNLHDMFPSKWLSASDIGNREIVVTISAVTYEKVKQMNGDGLEEKMALHFRQRSGEKPLKPLLLNKVNTTTLIVLFGDDDENWFGKRIKLGFDMVPVGKEIKPGVRIRNWSPDSDLNSKQPSLVETYDDVPF